MSAGDAHLQWETTAYPAGDLFVSPNFWIWDTILFIYNFSLRIELQDAEAEDVVDSKDITKDTRRRQR